MKTMKEWYACKFSLIAATEVSVMECMHSARWWVPLAYRAVRDQSGLHTTLHAALIAHSLVTTTYSMFWKATCFRLIFSNFFLRYIQSYLFESALQPFSLFSILPSNVLCRSCVYMCCSAATTVLLSNSWFDAKREREKEERENIIKFDWFFVRCILHIKWEELRFHLSCYRADRDFISIWIVFPIEGG